MRVDMVNPFVNAAREVLRAELHDESIERGKLRLMRSGETSDDVSAMIAVSGGLRGLVLYTMSHETACALAGTMLGQDCTDLDDLGKSAIAELANMMTGKAGIFLEQSGLRAEISPPALVVGRGSSISTVDLQMLEVPIRTICGEIAIHLAIDEAA